VTRTLLVALVVSAVAASTAQGAAPQAVFDYDHELGAVARKSLRHAVSNAPRPTLGGVRRVYVRCYRDRTSFERAFERRFGVPAARVVAYYTGGPDLHLRGGTCANVRLFLQGRHTALTAASYSVLLHETLHRQGLRDERVTNCLANEAVGWGTEWLGFGEERARHARNLAFEFSKRYAPPDYRMGKPDCLALARHTDWTELV
jgi:hypothetical protein